MPISSSKLKNSSLEGRNGILSIPLMVQVMAFWLVFGAGADPGAVRLR
jgi:hypothetical protein